VYCRGCEYELADLWANVRPECGRPFDPSDASTFDVVPRRWRLVRRLELALIAAASVPLLANTFAFAALLGARILLGRWPPTYGDDPNNIDGIGFSCVVAMLLLMASLPALVAVSGLLMALLAQGATKQAIRGGALAACLWAGGFLLARWDPARAWFWIFD